MSDVPSEMWREILVRLPAECLLQLRSVCKEWLCMIDDPSFTKAHVNNQVYSQSHTFLLRNKSGDPLYSFSLDSLDFINGHQMIAATPIAQLFRCGVPLFPPLCASYSCNGLILIDDSKIRAIWNPLTKEFHELPKPKPDLILFGTAIGFGYDYEADDYKVVAVGHSAIISVNPTLIYSLKSNSWREIEDCPCRIRGPGSFLNGTLYWRYKDIIVALHLRTETYSRLPLPPVRIDHKLVDIHLDVLDGCLICTLDYRGFLFVWWVMKDDGVKKSWIKLVSLKYSLLKVSGRLRLVAYLKGKQQVVLQHDLGFLWFDIPGNSVKKFSIHGLPNITSSQICPGSLVRLNGPSIKLEVVRLNAQGIELGAVRPRRTLTRKRKWNTDTDTRLKFCVRNAGDTCCSDNHYCSEDSCRHCKEE